MEIVVEVGGWEHECCGAAIGRDDVVTFACIPRTQDDGQVRLIESHHDLGASTQVHGRVIDIHVVESGATRPILRLPSGAALRGGRTDEDAHLQDPWTGQVITSPSSDFRVTVQTDR